MKRVILIAGLLLAVNGCEGTSTDSDDSPGTNDETSGTFTAFVIDMVNNHTVDDGAAMDYATFEMLPDPDGDSSNIDAFRSLF